MDERTAQRARAPDAVANQQARKVLAPFVPLFSQWNLTVAHLAAKQLSRSTTEAEKLALEQRRCALAAEIRQAMHRFHEVVALERGNARYADVEAAFRRLLEMLGQ